MIEAHLANARFRVHLRMGNARVATAGGEMFSAVFRFLGELVGQNGAAPEPLVQQFRARLDSCVQTDEAGRPQLTIALPDAQALDGLAKTLASFLAATGK